jgi:hypothetical protein
VAAYFVLQAVRMKVSAATPTMTAVEKEASRLAVERVETTGGFAARRAAMQKLTEDERAVFSRVPQHMTAELNILTGKKLTVLQIRDFLSGEFDPLKIDDLMAYLKVSEKAGFVKLVRK